MFKRSAFSAAAYVKGDGARVSPDDYRARSQERAAREAADNRTEAQRWLGDPAPGRSALAQVRPPVDAPGQRAQVSRLPPDRCR
jgi:hypothetical protein